MPTPRWPAWAAAAVTAAVATATFLVISSTAHAATIFSDDFQDGNASGWSTSGGSWSVVTDGGLVYRQASTGADAKSLAGSTAWTNYAVSARVRPIAWSGTDRSAGVIARGQNSTNYYQLGLTNSGQVQLARRVGGGVQVLGSASATISLGTWYTLRLEAFGGQLRGFLDGVLVVSAVDSSFSAGRVGLFTRNASAAFDDLQVIDQPGPGGPSTPPTTSPPPPSGDCTVTGSANGFAAVNALGQNGTTGGAANPPNRVEVDTAAEFISAIGSQGPRTVCVAGLITLPPGMYNVTSDKSIIGLGANSGITGGGLNIGLPADDAITSPPANAVHNVIIQNMVFRNANDDSINVQMFSHHIWIDHNDLAAGFDGLIDIKRGSSYVTVSWNHTHDHVKNMLLGHDDGNAAQDVGWLKVTYHHNWFDDTPQRNPRVRFGEPVHIYNNYYFGISDAGVACQANAGCLVEGNYFEDVEEPITNSYAGPSGRCVARNNVFAGEEAGQADCSGSVQEASNFYSYTLDNPNNVRAIVIAGAGTF